MPRLMSRHRRESLAKTAGHAKKEQNCPNSPTDSTTKPQNGNVSRYPSGMVIPREIDIVSGIAVWYHTGFQPVPIRWVLIRDPKEKFKPQALLSTDPEVAPVQIIEWFVRRWQIEVTFQDVRAHLGVGTQRQWSNLAIQRTTPSLLVLFSVITLLAHKKAKDQKLPTRQTAWYKKQSPTFVDTLACVRAHLWQQTGFSTSSKNQNRQKLIDLFNERYIEAICYANSWTMLR